VFVDLKSGSFDNRQEILDARADLSLVGYGYMNMVDTRPTQALAILRGKACGVGATLDDSGKAIYPFRLLGGDRVAAEADNYPHDDASKPDKSYLIAAKKGNRLAVVARLPKPQTFSYDRLAFKAVQEMKKLTAWLRPEVARLSKAGFEDRGYLTFAVGAFPYQLVNVNFYPVTQGYEICMHDADRDLPAIFANGRYHLLRELVDGGSDYDFDIIAWASPEGWFIVRAKHRGHDGYAWIFPH
jgi:hypothetical protein